MKRRPPRSTRHDTLVPYTTLFRSRVNLFARGAAWLGTKRRLPAGVRRAYIAPYDGWANAISTLRFMQDIPLREGDRAWPLVAEAGRRLGEFADRKSTRLNSSH